MLYLMTNHINIIIIILLTIKIISLKAKQPMANNRFNEDAELYGNFTAIEFLKELEHLRPAHDNILIMQNQNATISNFFFTHLIKALNGNNSSGIAATNTKAAFGVSSEMATTTFANCLMDSLQVPVLQLNELQSFYLKRHYSEHLLSIVYIDINIEGIQMTLNDHKGLLEKLSATLLHMTTSKVMFLLNFPLAVSTDGDAVAAASAQVDEDVVQDILVQLFHHCWQQKIINVVALLANYQISRKFYSYNHFPEFQMETKSIIFDTKLKDEMYPYRLANLKRFKLPVAIGGGGTRIIPYKNQKGEEIFGGSVGHFIRAFAKKFNCTLIHPLLFNRRLFSPSIELVKAVRNSTVEISAGVTLPDIPFIGFTYPIELLKWCIMLPVEADIPDYKFFTLVFKGETYLLVIAIVILLSMVLSAALCLHGYRADLFDIFCHDDCLRGILGQSFSEIANPPTIIRVLYLEICVLGILLTTTYTSYFSTYVTHPPKETSITSYDDILWSGLKIVIWEPEYLRMGVLTDFKKYLPFFYVVKDFEEFSRLRDSFNTKYGYIMPDGKWTIIEEQQKIFTTPLFRQLPNFCLVNLIPISFPVHENSIYFNLVNQLILETSQSGLLSFWNKNAFFELISAKKLQLKDLSPKKEFQGMTVDDLRYILIFLGGMLVFVTLVFLCEQMVFHRRRIFSTIAQFLYRTKISRSEV